jgi:hypothetical protein
MKIKLFVALALIMGLAIGSAEAQVMSGRHQKDALHKVAGAGSSIVLKNHVWELRSGRFTAIVVTPVLTMDESVRAKRKMLQQERRKHSRHILSLQNTIDLTGINKDG